MGRQTQLHLFPKDLNELLVAMQDKEPLEAAMKSGNTPTPERLAFVPENISGKTLVLWSERFAPNLQRDYIANAHPPYYVVQEQTESVFELSLSTLTTWEGRPALTQGRIYAVFGNKHSELEKCYERIVRYIRRLWRKNPAAWMGGYIAPAANEWFERGGLLLPSYIPPVRSTWIQRLGKQHPTGC
jgi:hypothetical protein